MWADINWMDIASGTLVGVYLFVLLAVAVYGFHRYILLYLYRKYKHNAYLPKSTYTDLPRITIQLPMFNEDSVAERIVNATCQVDYPLDKLEIQVLDDSTDHSADIAREAVEKWAAKGYPIKFIHRENRVGYKAGALAEGLKTATGDFIAIFDADFIPPKDILRNVVDYFTDDKVGMVQVRWDHLNRDASLLTRSQAMFLDGHFVIEHTARNRSGRFMHFNGTAGVWRRTCIDDGGGWEHDTLTEDLDLSYRCQMKGWQFVYLPQFCAPAELPPEMIAFKQQAHRWTKGSFQTCIKLLPKVLRSKHLSRGVKVEAFFHLTNTIVYPLMVLMTVLMAPTFFHALSPFSGRGYGQTIMTASLFVLATCSSGMFFVFGQRELFGREATWRSILYTPVLMALGVGVCINNSKAFFEAIWGAIRKKPSVFVRTRKYGVTGRSKQSERTSSADRTGEAEDTAVVVNKAPRIFTLKKLILPLIEVAFGIYMIWCVIVTVMIYLATSVMGAFVSIPFLLIFASGYLYVGCSSIVALWRMQEEANAAEEEEAAEQPEIAGGL